MSPIEIARVYYTVKRAYYLALGDYSQAPWDTAPDWQKQSAVDSVKFHLGNPYLAYGDLPVAWQGPPDQKQSHQPEAQKANDFICKGVVDALR